MKQQELYEKMLKQQEERIQEMENLISILEKENKRKDQMIAELEELSQMHEKYISKYSDAMKQMLKDFQ